MKYNVTINNNNYEVEVERGQASIVKTDESAAPSIVTHAVTTEEPKTSVPAPKPVTNTAQSVAGEKICAPMPGLILQIKKNIGDPVKKGDVLFVLEAMKMENEIFSALDGMIGQILTSKGTNVETGDVLAIIK